MRVHNLVNLFFLFLIFRFEINLLLLQFSFSFLFHFISLYLFFYNPVVLASTLLLHLIIFKESSLEPKSIQVRLGFYRLF